jgi:signal transduction histidine kinase
MRDILSSHDKTIIGLSLPGLFPENEKLIQSVAERKKNSLEIVMVDKEAERYYEVDINVLLDKTNDYNGCILIFHDITQRKKDALSLVALNQLKDRIFSIVAHDLRSPLINITDMVKLIGDEAITEKEFRMFLPQLSKSLNYTSGLLDNLLHWSKSQLNGEVINPVVVDIRNIVQHEILYYQARAIEKGIKLQHSIEEATPVEADVEMIQLVIRNLVGNAVKFCSTGDTITLSASYNNLNEVVIRIRDTGSGMKPDTVERLFLPQTFTTRGTNNEQGTGLGLQLCKDFVEKNNGKIWATSEWGKGSDFYFTLPKA